MHSRQPWHLLCLQGYARVGEEAQPPPLPQGYARVSAAVPHTEQAPKAKAPVSKVVPAAPAKAAQPTAEKDLLTSLDESPRLTGLGPIGQTGIPETLVKGAVKGARGLRGIYHGLVGDEATPTITGPTTTASPAAENLGFTPENVGYNLGKMGHGIYEFGKSVATDLLGSKTPVVVPDEKGVA